MLSGVLYNTRRVDAVAMFVWTSGKRACVFIACIRESVTIYGKNHYLRVCLVVHICRQMLLTSMPTSSRSLILMRECAHSCFALAHKQQNNRCTTNTQTYRNLKFTFGPAHSGNFSASCPRPRNFAQMDSGCKYIRCVFSVLNERLLMIKAHRIRANGITGFVGAF